MDKNSFRCIFVDKICAKIQNIGDLALRFPSKLDKTSAFFIIAELYIPTDPFFPPPTMAAQTPPSPCPKANTRHRLGTAIVSASEENAPY
ncbi:MAG: hypothetical protein II449_02550, partial [Prevotella sp.]|nr:hypothetical protein [Prevotella sp.]